MAREQRMDIRELRQSGHTPVDLILHPVNFRTRAEHTDELCAYVLEECRSLGGS